MLPRLPETFTFSDAWGLLGYTPNRCSLYRALQKLRIRGDLAVEFPGSGTRPAQYRKVEAGEAGSDS
ncbi:MAG TPA: hypothetical protein VGG20_23040 [Thermoanaerobaculia bacterium]